MNKQPKKWKYPSFPPQPFDYSIKVSLIDPNNPESELNKSQLKGFYNLTIIFIIIFFITKPIVNLIDHGYFFDLALYENFRIDFFFCISCWPLFFLWSFTSYILQIFIIKGLNSKVALILQHLTQSGLFVYSLYVLLVNDWCTTHRAFILMQACVHFMKMHSYITVNRDYREQYQEAKRNNTKPLSNYPNNVNFKDFLLYMFTPWLVYANYPRKKTISWIYVLKKGVTIPIVIIIMYMIFSQYMLPYIKKGDSITFVELVCRLLIHLTSIIFLFFFLVFQCMCNFFAELTRLDFRQFYEDWWNSTTFEQFNRKWNKPVHFFLYRHVYTEVYIRYKKSKMVAKILTFVFSALLHEYLATFIFRTFAPVLSFFMLLQIPLIQVTKWMRKKRSGIYLFWFGILQGSGLIIAAYLRVDPETTKLFTT